MFGAWAKSGEMMFADEEDVEKVNGYTWHEDVDGYGEYEFEA